MGSSPAQLSQSSEQVQHIRELEIWRKPKGKKGQKKRTRGSDGSEKETEDVMGGDDKKIWIRKEQMIERNEKM